MHFLFGLVLIVGLTVMYSVSFSENANTGVPAGCEHLLAECGSCHDVSCGHYGRTRNEEN